MLKFCANFLQVECNSAFTPGSLYTAAILHFLAPGYSHSAAHSARSVGRLSFEVHHRCFPAFAVTGCLWHVQLACVHFPAVLALCSPAGSSTKTSQADPADTCFRLCSVAHRWLPAGHPNAPCGTSVGHWSCFGSCGAQLRGGLSRALLAVVGLLSPFPVSLLSFLFLSLSWPPADAAASRVKKYG